MQQNVFYPPDAAALEHILQRENASATGVVLRLAWQAGLTRDEISNLTWSGVNLITNELYLPDRTVPLAPDTAACLSEWQTLVGEYGPYVVVSEQRKARLAPQSISRLARTALDAEGQAKVRLLDLRYDFVLRALEAHDWPYVLRISGISVTTYRNCLADVRKGGAIAEPETHDAKEDEYNLWKLMQSEQDSPAGIALTHGSISRAEAMALLGLNEGKVYSRLNALTFTGELVRINFRYYPAGTVVLPEQQAEAIKQYLAENGSAYCSDIAELLHIGKRPTARLLKRMVERGELALLRREKRYLLDNKQANIR